MAAKINLLSPGPYNLAYLAHDDDGPRALLTSLLTGYLWG
jgi:hypothetical protein